MIATNRRTFLAGAAAFSTLMSFNRSFGQGAPEGPFKLGPLPYSFAALEPFIDAKTMELHHDKHHAAYVKNLNNALKDYPQLAALPLEQILAKLGEVPESVRTAIRNNGEATPTTPCFGKSWRRMAASRKAS